MSAKETAIKGKNINLREIGESDLPKMVEWRNKDRIRKCLFNQELITLEKQKKWFKDYYLNKDDDKIFIIEAKDSIPIGTIALKDLDSENGKAEFGRMMIGEDEYLGKGFAKDATMTLLNYAFNKMNLKKLHLETLTGNKGAICLYEKYGFKIDASLERTISINGSSHKIITMVK